MSLSNCIGEVSHGKINYSVDVLVCCKHDGTDDGIAPAIIRLARRPPNVLITDHAVLSFRRLLV